MRREVPEGGGSTRGARVLYADAREPGSRRPMRGKRGARGGGERCDQSSEEGEGEAGKEPSQEALRRMIGDAIARGGGKPSGQGGGPGSGL